MAGVHRSGTSLAAEMLVRLGGFTRDRLLEGNQYNPRGYWEDAGIVGVHERILVACGRSWGSRDSLLPMPEGWLGRADIVPLREELEALLVSGSEAAEAARAPWIVKDPRICRLLPLWRDIGARRGTRLAVVLSVRAPAAVAASLERRDQLPPAFGRLSWLVNHVDLLNSGHDLIVECVSYDRWFTDARRQARRLAAAAGLRAPATDIATAIATVVNPEFRHHEPVLGDGMADRLFNELDRWSETGKRSDRLDEMSDLADATLADLVVWLGSASEPDALHDSLEAQLNEFRTAYRASAARADDLQSLVWRLQRPLTMLRALRRAIRKGRAGSR